MPFESLSRCEPFVNAFFGLFCIVAFFLAGHVRSMAAQSPPTTALDFELRHQEARRFLLTNDFAEALVRYEKLTRQYPNIAALWLEYGNAAVRLRKMERAITAWNRALTLSPQNAELISLIGHQYQGVRLPSRARDCFVQ